MTEHPITDSDGPWPVSTGCSASAESGSDHGRLWSGYSSRIQRNSTVRGHDVAFSGDPTRGPSR